MTSDRIATEDYADAAAAGAGTSSFTFDQNSPAATWTIAHGLGFFPAVTVVDSGGREFFGGVTHVDADNLTIDFSSAQTGHAYLS